MLFISIDDFYEKVSKLSRISREEEIECAKRMKMGDSSARERLVEGYLQMVASHMKRMPKNYQTLGLAWYCVQALEKAVDKFDFSQGGETFVHRLSWYLRQASTKYIAEKYNN